MSRKVFADFFPHTLLCCRLLQPQQPCLFSKRFTKFSSVETGGHLTSLNLQSHHIKKLAVAAETHDLFSEVELIAPCFSASHFPQDKLANRLAKEQHKSGSKYCTYIVIHVAVKDFAFIM